MKQLKFLFIAVCSLICLVPNAHAQQKTTTNQTGMKQQSVVTISAFTAKGDMTQLKIALNDGLDAGLTITEIKEMLVQLYAYAGFPRSLNAINILMAVLDERKEKGITDDEGDAAGQPLFSNGKYAYGKDVQTTLTGTTAIGEAQQFVPIIDTFLKEHLFADIFSRDVLSYQTREMVTIAALASMDGTESQLKSHLNVGKNVGLTEQQLRDIASTISTKVSWQKGNVTFGMIDAIFNSKDEAAAKVKSGEKRDPQNQQELGYEGAITSNEKTNTIFPQGEKAPAENFTGTAWVNRLAKQDVSGTYSVGNVVFEAGARTNWHLHPGGQTLIVTDGVGWYQEKGKPARSLHKGDVVLIPANTVHWHGACKDSSFTHIALTNLKDGGVKWLTPVIEEEYNSLNK